MNNPIFICLSYGLNDLNDLNVLNLSYFER